MIPELPPSKTKHCYPIKSTLTIILALHSGGNIATQPYIIGKKCNIQVEITSYVCYE